MYVTQSEACDLPNSETPLTQAQIDRQDQRVARTGSKFVRGNQDLGNLCNNLTPPVPIPSCDAYMTNSNALRTSGVFPVPSAAAAAAANPITTPTAADISAPVTFDDLIAAAPASSAPAGTVPASNGSAPAAAPVSTAPGGGYQICLPRMFTPGGLSGLGARRLPRRPLPGMRRGLRGFGGLGDYLMPGAVRLIDGTVINDPANTVPTPAQCLPYQCGADPSNQAARYWCSYYGQATTLPPCTDPRCAPWKPSYCTTAPAAAGAVAPPPAAAMVVYPYGPLQVDLDNYVPARCNGGNPSIPGGLPSGGSAGGGVCFSLASPLLWGTVAALGLGIWALSRSEGRA